MKRTVVVLPATMLCSGCGFNLRADDKYRHGETHHVVECFTQDCPQYGERLAFPLLFVECEVKTQQQSAGGC